MSEARMTGRMRWFWRGWIASATAALMGISALAFGGAVEAYYDPPIVNVSMVDGSIERTDAKLCYKWTSDKLRPTLLTNVDSFLERPLKHDMSFPTVFDGYTGVAWHTAAAHRVGNGDLHYQCVDLSTVGSGKDAVDPSEPLILNVTSWFRSQYGPWQVPLHLPEVVSLGTK